MANATLSRFQLPGFGLPVNCRPEDLFKNALDSTDLMNGYVQCVLYIIRATAYPTSD